MRDNGLSAVSALLHVYAVHADPLRSLLPGLVEDLISCVSAVVFNISTPEVQIRTLVDELLALVGVLCHKSGGLLYAEAEIAALHVIAVAAVSDLHAALCCIADSSS